MRTPRPITTAALTMLALSLAAPAPRAGDTPEAEAPPALESAWSARHVEHLLNRAGFGARPDEITSWVERGPEALVDHLLAERPGREPFFVQTVELDRASMRGMNAKERRMAVAGVRGQNRNQFHSYLGWWFEEMLRTDDPLRERMTLFWHGFFTSSMTDVQLSGAMIRQNQYLRENALAGYAVLLRGILRDPAMLIYLNNDTNVKGQPNENLARELMELFSLGEGNYTEQDVREAARALTGMGTKDEEFVFKADQHDRETKVILGVEGPHDADDLVRILLQREECGRWVAGRLITYLEGMPPTDERLGRYAGLLRDGGYAVRPFLRELFLDPDFYRDEVLGAREASPVDYMVGSCLRLGIEPPGVFLALGARQSGQALLDPPSVKGWEEGAAWITTSALMTRGNMMGLLLGTIPLEGLVPDAGTRRAGEDPEAGMDDVAGMEDAADTDPAAPEAGSEEGEDVYDVMQDAGLDMFGEPRPRAKSRTGLEALALLMKRTHYMPHISFVTRLERAGVSTDAELVDVLAGELLAIPLPEGTRGRLIEFVRHERELRGVEEASLLADEAVGETLSRELAHLVLSLPEAQLH